jgi:dTDP-4-dehydrorhamnose reductase
MKILLIASHGQVGFQLQRSLACLGELISTNRASLDLTKTDELVDFIRQSKPDLIVNAGAYTAVDKAETEKTLAYKVNAEAPGIIAKLARELDIALIHYSTDYVFDGHKDGAWNEHDKPAPLNYYGQSKLEGEYAVINSGCNYLIFRVSWVYDRRGKNFVNTMLRLAKEKDELSIVDDQIGAPTWSRHIADATAQIIVQSKLIPDFWEKYSGIFHMSAAGKTSWKEFADTIFELAAHEGMKVPVVNAIPTSAYPTKAQRLLNSCMDNSKIFNTFGVQLPDWQSSLQWVMRTDERQD